MAKRLEPLGVSDSRSKTPTSEVHRRLLLRVTLTLAIGIGIVGSGSVGIANSMASTRLIQERSTEAADRWEADMQRFAELDRESPPTAGGVLFVGSSSIRLWDLQQSFPDRQYVNRGFGGSEIADSLRHFDRLVTPHQPRLIVLYAGDNDIANGLTAAETAADFARFAARVHRDLPETRVVYLTIKPSASRWSMIEEQREANRRIEALCAADRRLRYVDLASCLLGENGEPNPAWFEEDALHLNAAGYEIWTARLREVLREIDSP